MSSESAVRVDERILLLEQAIGLWRGSPLVDVRYEEFAQGEIRWDPTGLGVPVEKRMVRARQIQIADRAND